MLSLIARKSKAVFGEVGSFLGVIMVLPLMFILLWLDRGDQRADRETEKKILKQLRDMQRSRSRDGKETGA